MGLARRSGTLARPGYGRAMQADFALAGGFLVGYLAVVDVRAATFGHLTDWRRGRRGLLEHEISVGGVHRDRVARTHRAVQQRQGEAVR